MPGVEQVTVLFTDMVGSTALSSSVSVDAADALRRDHFSLLRRAVAACGGTEVKNLGDGLMAVFPSASSALACSVAMQQAVDQYGRARHRPIGLRVGVSCGEATREDQDYFGEPVIEASRLCARAEAGQILVSALVQAVAGRRSQHSFQPLGGLVLKGLPEPVETCLVDWEPVGPELSVSMPTVPLPASLGFQPRGGVIGRGPELIALGEAVKQVIGGAGRRVVFISGEAGQGKTTLAAEAARRAYEEGAVVLLGRCDEDLGTPYGPFVEAISHYVTHAEADELRSYVRAHGGALTRLVPNLAKRLGETPAVQRSDPDTERYLLYGAVVALLGEIGAHRALVLVLDDLSWADTASLELLRHLIKHTEDARLLVLGAFRDTELTRSHPLTGALAALRREHDISRLNLKGLSDDDVVALLTARAGHELDEQGVAFAHAVYRETDGNPFFVTEVLRDLVESGALLQEPGGRWRAGRQLAQVSLPDSVREVVGARIARIGENATTILSLAAVIGRDFDVGLLAAVASVDEDELLDLLDAAQASALVREAPGVQGRYSFVHALVQHTLYQGLGSTRRAIAHRQVAEALEGLLQGRPEDHLDALAHHYVSATRPTDVSKAVSFSRQAGERALANLAPNDAVSYFTQALDLAALQGAGDPLERVDLLLALGTAQRQAGISAFRETLLEASRRARDLKNADRLIQAALANNRGWFSAFGETDRPKVQMLETALKMMDDRDSDTRAVLLATLCSELIYDRLDRRIQLASEAKAMAERLGHKETTLKVIILCDVALQVPSLSEERRRESYEALALAEELGDPASLFLAASTADKHATHAGDFETARRCLATMKRVSDQLHQPTLVWNTVYREAAYAVLAGDTSRAEALASAAFDLGTEAGQPDAAAFFGTQLVIIRHQQGRAGELLSMVDEVARDNPSVPAYRGGQAFAHVDAGNDLTARRILEDAAAEHFPLPLDTAWMDGLLAYAYTAIELEATGPAGQLFEYLAPYHGQVAFDGVIGLGPVAEQLAGLCTVLGRFEQAEAYFEEAMDLIQAGGLTFPQAATRMLWGRMLLARGEPADTGRARQLLEQARSEATLHGYATVERRATAALERAASHH